ncbi:MAG: small multi-drug export protein [Dehalococcoidales bacterium]|jgi:uncharacterized membrane protein
MIEQLIGSGFSPEVIIFFASALPIAESRVALPLAINLFGISWYRALFPAIIGNLLPVPPLLLFFASLGRLLDHWELSRRVSDRVFESIRKRAALVEKYGTIGLVLFVAVPFPGTGAWTGAMVASLMGLGFRRAMLAITSGVIISAAVVTALSLIGWPGAVIAGVVLFGLAVLQFRGR